MHLTRDSFYKLFQLVGKLPLQRLILHRIKSHTVDRQNGNTFRCCLFSPYTAGKGKENVHRRKTFSFGERFVTLGLLKAESTIFWECICFVRNGYFRLNVSVSPSGDRKIIGMVITRKWRCFEIIRIEVE